MVIKSFISVICTCLVFSFQAQAFNFGDFAKETLEKAKKSQATNESNAQDKSYNHTAFKTGKNSPLVTCSSQ